MDTYEKQQAMLQPEQEYILEKPYKYATEYRAQILKNFREGKNFGEPSGMSKLDKNLTIVPGYFYGITGWPGSGKSEFVTNLLILQATGRGRKCCVYAPEGYPLESYIETIAHAYLGKSVSQHYRNHCTEEELIEALNWIDQFFIFLNWKDDTPTLDMIMDAFKFCHNFMKCTVFLIDPFNSLSEAEDEQNMAKALKKALNQMVQFTHNNKLIFFVIEHPRSPKDSIEASKVPGAHQLFGGTMWWNKVDCLLAVHSLRDEKGGYTGEVVIRVHKMKNQKLNGRPGEVVMKFDIATNRYA